MRNKIVFCVASMVGVFAICIVILTTYASAETNSQKGNAFGWHGDSGHSVQLGPRPFFVVEDMDENSLKNELQQCTEGPFKRFDFSIGHRGAALQFPEHTKESYVAAAGYLF